MFAVTGELPVLIAVKAGTSPEPVAGSPIPGMSLVQVKVDVPPVLPEVKVTSVVCPLLQSTWFAGWLTCADGFTVNVMFSVGPSQVTDPLAKCGVTVMVATTGALPVLTAENEGMFPVPLAKRPMVHSGLGVVTFMVS